MPALAPQGATGHGPDSDCGPLAARRSSATSERARGCRFDEVTVCVQSSPPATFEFSTGRSELAQSCCAVKEKL